MEEPFEYLRVYKFVERDGVKRLIQVAKFVTSDPLVVNFAFKMFRVGEYFFAYDM